MSYQCTAIGYLIKLYLYRGLSGMSRQGGLISGHNLRRSLEVDKLPAKQLICKWNQMFSQ